jgi:hypothetical protein
LLPLHFDDIRPESRTPRYAEGTRTDFLLAPERIALTVKCTGPALSESQLMEQLREDAAYWRAQRNCRMLIGFVYDPDALLRETVALEAAWSEREDGFELNCLIAAP